jgi:hypothetical protein
LKADRGNVISIVLEIYLRAGLIAYSYI